jgi:hypothetical protein
VTSVQVYNVSGSGSAGNTTIRVYNVAGAGVGQPTLQASQAVYDPGELVTITAINGTAPHTFAFPAGAPGGVNVTDNVLTFPAPALKDAAEIQIAYNQLAYLTVKINQAFVLIGGQPATIWINEADGFGAGGFGAGGFGD